MEHLPQALMTWDVKSRTFSRNEGRAWGFGPGNWSLWACRTEASLIYCRCSALYHVIIRFQANSMYSFFSKRNAFSLMLSNKLIASKPDCCCAETAGSICLSYCNDTLLSNARLRHFPKCIHTSLGCLTGYFNRGNNNNNCSSNNNVFWAHQGNLTFSSDC